MKQKLWINNNIEDRTYMLEKTEESPVFRASRF